MGFSLSKIILAMLTQIAIQEGFIKNANEPMINYFSEFEKADSNFKKNNHSIIVGYSI